MAQIDDFKAAVATELADMKAVLDKLAAVVANPSPDDPAVADLIAQLQASHAAAQAALNPPAAPAVPAS